ncbi:MAG: hypothetical protein ACI4AH_00780 [Muribaculaceae bacterium]
MRKDLCKLVVFCLGAAMLLSSCGKSKFDEAVELLGSLPVFFDNERLNQTVTYEDDVITLSLSYQPQTSQWANDVIGDDWVAEVFLQKLLGNNIAAYTIGSVLSTEDSSPIDEFLSLAKKKNVKFVVKNGSNEVTLSPDEVSNILEDDSNKNLVAPYFAKQIEKLANDLNSQLQDAGIYMANAKMLKSPTGVTSICIYINCLKKYSPSKINPVVEESLEVYPTIPIYCHLNDMNLAIQYHLVDSKSELTNNLFVDYLSSNSDYYSIKDKIFFVSAEKLSKIWESFKERAEKAENK